MISSRLVSLGLLALVPAAADITFSDSTFSDSDWTGERLQAGSVASFQARQSSTGGNPGAFRHLTHTFNEIVGAAHLNGSAVYDPSTQGAIGAIEYSFDLSRQSQMPVAYWILLVQGGTYYLNGPSSVTPLPGVWQTFSRSSLRSADFSKLSGGGPATPDFSIRGARIQFGYYASNTSTGPTITTVSGIDNWSVTVRDANRCEARRGQPGTYFDGDFSTNNWDVTMFVSGNGGTSRGTQVAAGGNPGTFRQVDMNVGSGSVATPANAWAFHRRTGATYDPRSQGAIASLDYCEDFLFLGTGFGDGQANGVALRQGGKVFTGYSTVTRLPNSWTRQVQVSLAAGQLYEIRSTPQIIDYNSHPDFSANGAPIEFGFFRANSSIGNAYSSSLGIDNWTVIVNAASPSAVREIGVQPATLEFRAMSGGAAPLQTAHVVSEGSSAEVQLVATTQRGGNWLRITPSSGATPIALEVTADPTALPAGDYLGAIEVRVPAQAALTRRVEVRFAVSGETPPSLAAEPSTVQVSAVRGAAPFTRMVRLVNRGSGAVNYTATVDYEPGPASPDEGQPSWVEVAPTAGVVAAKSPAGVVVNFAVRTLAPGVHRARILVRAQALDRELVIPVTVAVGSGGVALQLSQTGLSFLGATGGPSLLPQSVDVIAQGEGANNWTAAASVDEGLPSWLTISRTAGSTGDSFSVGANPAGLAAGDYAGQVRVDAAGVENAPRFVFVALRVVAANVPLDPDVRPGGLIFTSTGSQTVTIFNPNSAAIRIESQVQGETRAFSVVAPTELNIAPGGSSSYRVTATSAGLAPGTYRSSLTFRMAGTARTFPAQLVLVVPQSARTASVQRFAEADCAPGGLRIVSLRQAIGFASVTGFPMPVEARVVDTEGRPLSTGAVTAALTGTAYSASNLVHISADPGRWSGTLQPPAQSSGPIVLRLLAQDATGTRTGCVDLGGTLESTDAPVIADGGVLSGASFVVGAPLSGGGMTAIFGTRLASGTAAASSLPLPAQLGETRVAIGGRSVALFYAGDLGDSSQVNGILPYGLAANTTQQLTVRRGGRFSVAEVLIAGAQPAVFTVDQSGGGAGIAVHGSDPGKLVDAANPAIGGEIVVIYCEGLGAVDPAPEAGSRSPDSPLARTSGVTVTIGGIEAQVLFAGLTPGLAGLSQINAVVPSGVAPGNAVPLVVRAAGQVSRTVLLAVR